MMEDKKTKKKRKKGDSSLKELDFTILFLFTLTSSWGLGKSGVVV